VDTDATAVVHIVLGARRTTIAYQPGDTLLETARRAGLQPPFSCEAGNCATCMAQLRSGGATMRVNDALTPDEVDDGWVLTCQALPTGPEVTVDYDAL
jgi:ferredoxin